MRYLHLPEGLFHLATGRCTTMEKKNYSEDAGDGDYWTADVDADLAGDMDTTTGLVAFISIYCVE